MANARFWVWVHGPAKITLRPGQRLQHYWSTRTEEGWSGEGSSWEHDADRGGILRESITEGRDCDGMLTQTGEDFAPYANLRAGYQDEIDPEIVYPVWDEIDSAQRDEYAEAAGY